MSRLDGAAAPGRRLQGARSGAAESTGRGAGRFAAPGERLDEERD
jgi:hypothetical protein